MSIASAQFWTWVTGGFMLEHDVVPASSVETFLAHSGRSNMLHLVNRCSLRRDPLPWALPSFNPGKAPRSTQEFSEKAIACRGGEEAAASPPGGCRG